MFIRLSTTHFISRVISVGGDTGLPPAYFLSTLTTFSIMQVYVPFSKGKPHPAVMRSSAVSLLARPHVPSEEELRKLIAEPLWDGRISDLQLDAIALARRAHIENEALINADSTGSGKGRFAVCTILNSWLLDSGDKSNRRALYFSANNVFQDVKRDNTACKTGAKVCEIKKREDITIGGDVILYVNYQALLSKPKDGKSSNIEFLRNYVRTASNATNFPVLFDEAHCIKNLGNGSNSSQTAQAALDFLDSIRSLQPRITFASATFASKREDLKLYSPFVGFVGLSSTGASFPTFEVLQQKLSSVKDAPGLEFLSAELVKRGRLLQRTLAYDGVRFEEEKINLTDQWIHRHDAAALLFQALFELELYTTKTRKATFFGSQLRFFKSLLLSGKVDRTVTLAKEQLQCGRSVVISLIATGEAAANRAAKKQDDEIAGVADAGVREVLNCLIDKTHTFLKEDYPEATPCWKDLVFTNTADTDVDADLRISVVCSEDEFKGCIVNILSVTSDQKAEVSFLPFPQVRRNFGVDPSKKVMMDTKKLRILKSMPENEDFQPSIVDRLNAIKRQAHNILLPHVSPLDRLKAELGGSACVAELTGRSKFLEPIHGTNKWKSVNRKTKADDERNAFCNGVKKVAILSEALSTGISLHADGRGVKAVTQIFFENADSAETALQQAGRTNRAGQFSPPKFIFVVSNFDAEVRFSATVGARLTALGAISTGDRETLTTSSRFHSSGCYGIDAETFVSKHAKEALRIMFESNEETANILKSIGFPDTSTLDGRRFMNRSLACNYSTAKDLFADFVDHLYEALADAEQRGTLNAPIETLNVKPPDEHGIGVKLVKTLISETFEGKVHVFRQDRGMSFTGAQELRNEILETGVKAENVFFALHNKERDPCLIWHSTKRMFWKFNPLGQRTRGHIDQIPDAVVPDAAFSAKWLERLKSGENEAPRVCEKYVLALPALGVIAKLGAAQRVKLVKMIFSGDEDLATKKTIGVDLNYSEGSTFLTTRLRELGFATSEAHALLREKKKQATLLEAEYELNNEGASKEKTPSLIHSQIKSRFFGGDSMPSTSSSTEEPATSTLDSSRDTWLDTDSEDDEKEAVPKPKKMRILPDSVLIK